MSNMQKCGFCSLLSGLFRRALCIGSGHGNSESYYRELGDQDTLKIDGSQGTDADDSATEYDVAFTTNEFDLDPLDEYGGVQDKGSDTDGDQDNELPNAHGEQVPDVVETALDAQAVSSDDNIMVKRLVTGRFLSLHRRRRGRLVTRSLTQDAALLDDLQHGQVQCVLEQSGLWKFNAFTLDTVSAGRCLPVLCMHLFQSYGLISHFDLDPAILWRLFCKFEEGYHSSNPYHNSIHAADVTQAMHCFLQQKVILEYLEPIEVMAALMAAIVHDLDHPGVNQQFLIATSNHLAALYENKSVLENHHWRSAVSILLESQILDQMSGYKEQLFRQISSLILATDITRQQEYLSQFKTYMDTNTMELRLPAHRHLILQIALKCADISNPCRPWDISRKWSYKVCEEFFRQGDFERRLSLPVTALCDRHATTVPKIQTGFFKYVVTPLISEWHRFLKNDLSAQMLHNLVYNQNEWEMMVSEEIAAEASQDVSDGELADDDDSSPNTSDSSEMLLPQAHPRRCSLNPARPTGFGEQMRRFSVPLNVFEDVRTRNQVQAPKEEEAPSDSLSPDSVSSPSEKLVAETSIASITTPQQATRIQSVFRSGGGKLLRQKTFPPLEGPRRLRLPRASSEERCASSSNKSDTLKFDDNVMTGQSASAHDEEGWNKMGDQLRDNLAAVSLGASANLGRRRKSMPAEVLTNRDSKFRELCEVLPQLIRRTISPRDILARRRGSAPAPGAADRGKYNGHNGNRIGNGARLPRALQMLSTTPEPIYDMPRRGSLPVEKCHHTEPVLRKSQ